MIEARPGTEAPSRPSPSPPWTELGDGIRVRQSRVFWMNSVVLEHREHLVLVDPGVLPSELDDLDRAVQAVGAASLDLIFTHGDWDHVLGRSSWPTASTVAHDRFAAEIRGKRDSIAREASETAARSGERWSRGFEPFRPDLAVSGLHFAKLGPWRVVLRDAPGHSPSMLSIHLPELGLLIAGDMLSDLEIPILAQPCEVYRRTLLDLVPLAEHGAIRILIPGHGSIARGTEAIMARITRDLGYLDELERGVRESRARGLSLAAAQEALATMSYTGKDAAYSMADYHRLNVEIVYQEPAAPDAPEPPSRKTGTGSPALGR